MNYCPNICMKTIFMYTENRKINEPHKFFLNLSQRVDFKSLDKNVALQDLLIYYTWKSIKKHYKNNKLKIIAPIGNDQFKLPDGSFSVSVIQDCIEYIIKKYESLTISPPIYIYIKIIINRSVFEIKDECKLELQRAELETPVANENDNVENINATIQLYRNS